MNQNDKQSDRGEGQFEVAAVARMVGLPPNTLRTWERRNFIQAATRTPSGRRRYSSTQVERIALFKKLTEAGDSIGTIADLDIESLRQRTHEFQTRGTEKEANKTGLTRIQAVGEKALLWTSILPENFKVFKEGQKGTPDIIVCELSGSMPECRQSLAIIRHEYPNAPIAVIYDFAPRGAVSELSNKNVFLIHAPCSAELLAHYIHAAIAGSSHQSAAKAHRGHPYADRLFSELQLAQIANSNSSIKCECPHHVSALVSSLASFEKYCQSCENESPGDAELHSYLGKEIASARGIVEQALLFLCFKENIPIPDDPDR